MSIDVQSRAVSADRPVFAGQIGGLRRVAPALGLFLLAPLTAEYLLGYDTSTGDIGALLWGLLFLAPLYGGPALLIREVARRSGRGWPTMLLLALAFGVLQPGLVDHSLFNPEYRNIESWEAWRVPSLIPALGISADMALAFILGHVIWSISAPIALVEAFVPDRQTAPWLRWPGLVLTAALYLLSSVLIFSEHVEEQFMPSAGQLAGTAAVVVALVVAAFAVGRRPHAPVALPAPRPRLVGAVALIGLSLPTIAEVVIALVGADEYLMAGWWGVGLEVALYVGLALLVVRWSRRDGWGAAHRLALAGGALLTNVWVAFLVPPLGDVPPLAKLGHNLGFALGVVVLLALAAHRLRAAREAQ
ncbi:MAG TPA: hypothetical protein VFS21_15850 [Roseiflexaceae bacterium]|nr:hypothetical protein [Roseiflexaceae bacterium]